MVSPSRNTPQAPQTISTGRLASKRPIPAGSARQVGFWRRGSGQRTASATNETTSTMAAAQPNSHSGIGRSDRTDIPCPIRNTGASPGFDYERREERVAAGVLGLVALDLELALEIRLEPEAHGLPGLDRLLDVVAVQVDVIGRIRVHHDHHGVALRRMDLLRAAYDLPAADLDARHHGRRRRRLLGVGLAIAAGGRRGLSCVVALVVPARARDDEREHGHDYGGDDQPYALIPRHGGGGVWLVGDERVRLAFAALS